MEELERCRTYGLIAWDLLVRQPALALVPAGAALPALLILAAPDTWMPEHPPRLLPLFVLLALVQVQMRRAFSRSIFATLRAHHWTTLGAWREGLLHPTRSSVLFSLIDGAVTAVALFFLAVVPFGAFLAGPWWCVSSLVSCAFAEGIEDPSAVRARCQHLFDLARVEMLVTATTVNLCLGLVLQIVRHFPIAPVTAFGIFYLMAMIPVRELLWQLFVGVLYYHTAPESE